MLHRDRAHSVTEVASIQVLAEKLTGQTWSLTSGFTFDGVLFLNDSTGQDAVQEYAVVVRGRQVESLSFTVGGTPEDAARAIGKILTAAESLTHDR
jgi:hypothetical protein